MCLNSEGFQGKVLFLGEAEIGAESLQIFCWDKSVVNRSPKFQLSCILAGKQEEN